MQEVGHVGIDAVHAHVGGQCHVVRFKLALEVCPGIHLGRGGDVAALDVGDRDATLGSDVLQRLRIGVEPLKSQGFVICDLQLEAGAAVGRGIHDAAVELEQGLTGHVEAAAECGRQVVQRRVEADADGSACCYGVKQLVDDHVCSSWR